MAHQARDEHRHVLEAGGVPVTVSVTGQQYAGARPLLLCNGIGAGIDQWGGFRRRLARPTIAFDVPEAEHLPTWATMGDFVDIVEAVIDNVAPDGVDVLGYSWGGVNIMETCIRDGGSSGRRRIGRAVVAFSLPGYTSVPTLRLRAALAMMSADRSPQRLARIGRQMYGDDITDPSILQDLHIAREVDAATYRKQQAALFLSRPLLPRLRGMDQPTLVLMGRKDPIVHQANGRLMQLAIPKARLRHMDCGHLGLLTNCDEAAGIVNDFLDEPVTGRAGGTGRERLGRDAA
jgi:pimeloyl-ACP methyl ester carboxylesterase